MLSASPWTLSSPSSPPCLLASASAIAARNLRDSNADARFLTAVSGDETCELSPAVSARPAFHRSSCTNNRGGGGEGVSRVCDGFPMSFGQPLVEFWGLLSSARGCSLSIQPWSIQPLVLSPENKVEAEVHLYPRRFHAISKHSQRQFSPVIFTPLANIPNAGSEPPPPPEACRLHPRTLSVRPAPI